MKVQHGKDLANHSGPESCGGAREGAAEALTGETGRSGIEPRNPNFGTPTLQASRHNLLKDQPGCLQRISPAGFGSVCRIEVDTGGPGRDGDPFWSGRLFRELSAPRPSAP